MERFGDKFRAMGIDAGGGVGRRGDGGHQQPEPLVPGSCGERGAGAGRSFDGGNMHGDLCGPEAAAGVRASDYAVWAGGMPMTKAEVVATLASPLNAFKIINTTETVGRLPRTALRRLWGGLGWRRG